MVKWFPAVSIVSSALLATAWFDQPHWFYHCVHWVVCAAAVASAYRAYELNKVRTTWIFAAIALLFNPLVPFHFVRVDWQALDAASALAFLVAAILLGPGRNLTSKPPLSASFPAKGKNSSAVGHDIPNLPRQHFGEFAHDHLAELWKEIEDALSQAQVQHRIVGEDFLDLESDEKVALLIEAGAFLGSRDPTDGHLIESFQILVSNCGLPQQVEKSLRSLTEHGSVARAIRAQLERQKKEDIKLPRPRRTK